MRLEDAVHVTHGDSAAAGVRQLGARDVRVWRDLLTIGPCDTDPAKHQAARWRHWSVPQSSWTDYTETVGSGGERVVWTSTAWSDRLYLFCLLDTLERMGATAPAVTLVQAAAVEPWLSLGALAPDRLRAAFDAAAPLDQALAAEGVALWRKWASPSPVAFDQARRQGSAAFPELSTIAEGHSAWFPFSEPDGRLRLSDVDEQLFHWIDDDWRSGVDLLKTPAARKPVQRVMGWVGDTGLYARLEAWSRTGAVEVRGDWRGRANDFAVRLTPAGRRLHDEGATSVTELAPVWIGGCLINDAKQPWVRVADSDGWQITPG